MSTLALAAIRWLTWLIITAVYVKVERQVTYEDI